jgi:hypothetical protein
MSARRWTGYSAYSPEPFPEPQTSVGYVEVAA